ncbi:MAG: hypothetical protein V1765_02965 [bacterium]
MFENFKFTNNQIDKYFNSAQRDLTIAKTSAVTEVAFRFAYDSLLKLAIAICAHHGLRVKARQGHHAELISKLAELLNNSDIEVIANEMRTKRNWDLYGGGALISAKETREYLCWIEDIFSKAEDIFKENKLKL